MYLKPRTYWTPPTAFWKHLLIVPVTITEPDPGQPSASPLFQVAWLRVQLLLNACSLSNPASGKTLALLGGRHTQALLEQSNDPAGQSDRATHCTQALLTHSGKLEDVQDPHM